MSDENVVEIGDVRVMYVPGADNRYVPYAETVVLDEGLREYPVAHREILEHELMHHKLGDAFFPSLWHEFRADAYYYLLRNETSRSIREYYGDMAERRTVSKKAKAVRAFRPALAIPLASVGILRHTILDPLEHARDKIREKLEIDIEEIEI